MSTVQECISKGQDPETRHNNSVHVKCHICKLTVTILSFSYGCNDLQ